MRRRPRLRYAVLALTIALCIAAACEDSVYVYSGRRYNAAGACLEPYKPIEVVPGRSVDLCRPSCFTVGDETFVSTLCPPLPGNATALQRDAATCVAALRLVDAACGDEGEESDAGEDEEEADADTSPIDAAAKDAAADG